MKELKFYIIWQYCDNVANDIEVEEKMFHTILNEIYCRFDAKAEIHDMENFDMSFYVKDYYGEWHEIAFCCLDMSVRVERLADEYYRSLET